MSKLPFVIAATQGVYKKHGLDVDFQLGDPPPDAFPIRAWRWMGRRAGFLVAPSIPDILVNGHGPSIIGVAWGRNLPHTVAIAATDCSVRDYVIARRGLSTLEDLKGKRLGINAEESTSGYAGLLLVQRMGWTRGRDISIVRPAGIEELQDGTVDAIIGGDEEIEVAEREGFPVLEDTRQWNESLAGNSAMVARGWLDDPTNREAARRFVRATVEAVALFHERPEVGLAVMAREYGISDRAQALGRYRRADYVPRKPYPCRDGISRMMAFYHIDENRRSTAAQFYDESLMQELDRSGFIDGVYRELAGRQ